MRRSAGVTISAVVVFVGCGFTALGALMMVMVGFAGAVRESPMPGFQYIAFGAAIFELGLAGWGIATGVGLIQLREWARTSMLVFSALLVVFTALPALILAILPMPMPTNGANADQMAQVIPTIHVFIALFYGAFAVLGAGWFYFFVRKSTREQFTARAALATTPVAPSHEGPAPMVFATQEPPMRRLGRPISITVIAVYMLIGVCFLPVSLLQVRYLLPEKGIPYLFFGRMITGWQGTTALVVLMAVQGIAAVGLLKLQPWARILAICTHVFGLLNIAISFGMPSSRAAFTQWMTSMMTAQLGRTNLPKGFDPAPMFEFVSKISTYGMLFSVPIFIVILWFLVKEKEAFYRTKEGTGAVS